MNLTVRIPDDIASRLAEAGVDPERVALTALSRAAEALQAQQLAHPDDAPRRSPAEAVARMRENRKGVTLGGLTIKDLINEGRR